MRILIYALLATMAMSGISAAKSRTLTVVGYLEDALILPVGLALKAKMDTGANVSSIHALDIRRYSKNGEDWVRFTVDTGSRRMVFRRRLERTVRIRRAGIATVERPVVRLGICIAGYYRNAQVSLNDRSGMTSPLLIGRRFMAPGGLVIDSATKNAGKPVCPAAPKK